MEIKKDGIHRHIESNEWGYFQRLGYEKVTEVTKEVKKEEAKEEVKPQVVKPKKTKKVDK